MIQVCNIAHERNNAITSFSVVVESVNLHGCKWE